MSEIPPVGETWMVTLESLGEGPGPRFMNGQILSGTIILSENVEPALAGTHWALSRLADGSVRLHCLAQLEGTPNPHIEPRRNLDGVTQEDRVQLVLAQSVPNSGQRWRAFDHPAGGTGFECLGDVPGSRFLDGRRTVDGTVALAPSLDPPFSGTRWHVERIGTVVTLECLGQVPGPNHFLDGRTLDASVGLANMAAVRFTGTHWLMQEVSGGITLMCLGELEGNRFLDGQVGGPVFGSVDLAPHTEFPFTGTRWELIQLENPHSDVEPGIIVNLRCLGEGTDPRRYLDGRTQDSTVGLAPTTEEPFTGTRWRMLSPAIWYEPCGSVPAEKSGELSAEVRIAERLGQLTGRKDPEGWALLNGDTTRWGVPGVDLGANCEHEGRLYIFSGDVLPGDRPEGEGPIRDADLIAFSEDEAITPAPGGGLRIEPVMSGQFFDPFRVEGPIGLTPTFEVPSGAFSHAQQVFVFTHIWDFNHRDPPVQQGCYLVSKFHPFGAGPFQQEYLFSPRTINGQPRADQFGGVAPWVVKNADHPWLPKMDREQGVVMFGIGYNPSVDYSAIQLAWVPLTGPHAPDLEDVLYFTNQREPWQSDPQHSIALFGAQPNLQSISAAYLEDLGQWIVIHMTANNTNRMSGPVVAHIGTPPFNWLYEFDLFDPCRERAYGKYMHWPGLDLIHLDDPHIQPGVPLPEGPGWAYGAFLLKKFTTWDPTKHLLDLYYLLSLSSPYQIQVMHTQVLLH